MTIQVPPYRVKDINPKWRIFSLVTKNWTDGNLGRKKFKADEN